MPHLLRSLLSAGLSIGLVAGVAACGDDDLTPDGDPVPNQLEDGDRGQDEPGIDAPGGDPAAGDSDPGDDTGPVGDDPGEGFEGPEIGEEP